jgi:hypothetical protein
MARKAIQFRNFPEQSYSPELGELLKMMGEIKAQINQEIINILVQVEPSVAAKRAVHSYKLDFETGQVELKVALVDKPKAKGEAKPQVSLGDWLRAEASR